jgi:BioD-like phosphotransacetylase family protein
MELNKVTPRIYVAATRQDDGKTTCCLGLYAALERKFPRIGYIKPVGQRFVEVAGKKVDEDSVLVSDTYDVNLPIEAMSPIAVDRMFTRNYLKEGNLAEMKETIVSAFNRVAWEHDFVIIEGTGHAGVGSVIDLSNAQVAKLLGSKVVIVTTGGVGRPVDEVSLNLALFEKEGVEVIGVVLNKVLPSKIEALRPWAERAFARMQLPILGVIPYLGELRRPILSQVAKELGGEFLSGESFKRRRVRSIAIGAMTAARIKEQLGAGSLLITPGDREDLLLAVLESQPKRTTDSKLAGILLTDGLKPQPGLLRMMNDKGVPSVAVAADSYSVTAKIERMTVKTDPGDQEKIKVIQKTVADHLDVGAILKKIGAERVPANNKR